MNEEIDSKESEEGKVSSELFKAKSPKPKGFFKQKKNLYIIGGVLIVLIIAAGSYTLGANFGGNAVLVASPTPAASPSPSPTFSPSSTATANPTAGWKTYSNDTYGISFKYPADWSAPSETMEMKVDTPWLAGDTSLVQFPSEKSKAIYVQISKASDYPGTSSEANYNKLINAYNSKDAAGTNKILLPPTNAGIMGYSDAKYIESSDGKYRGIYYFANIGQDYGVALQTIVILTNKTNVIQFNFMNATSKTDDYNCYFGTTCDEAQQTAQFNNYNDYMRTLSTSSTDEEAIRLFNSTNKVIAQSVK